MIKISKTAILPILLLVMILSTSIVPSIATGWSPYPLSPSDGQVAGALDYLASQQQPDGSIGGFSNSPWVVMALAAAGEDPNTWNNGGPSIVDYLASNAASASDANAYAKMILAAVAADQDPTSFGGYDFVSLLESEFDGTQIGNNTAINDDAWGIMALVSAGVTPSDPIISNAVDFIENSQNADGGWGWAIGQASDPDSTAAPIMALIAAGESTSSPTIQDALAYIKTQQDASGGFLSWGSTNPSTDAWCIDAIVAAGQDPTSAYWQEDQSGSNHDPIDDLIGFQQADGGFPDYTGNSDPWPTAYALQAMLGQPYPVAVLPAQGGGETVTVRVEGASGTIWAGDVTVTTSTIIDDQGNPHYLPTPTALGALDEASQAGGFDYSVHYFDGLGLAITSIGGAGDWQSGPWWLYRVNGADPGIGADAFEINITSPPLPPHTEILFFETTTFSEKPLQIALDKTEVSIGETFTATVTYYNGASETWLPLEGATVHADSDYTTAVDGTVSMSVDHDTTIEVYAEMDGYIRSNRVTVTIGDGGSPTDQAGPIIIQAEIIPAVAISVDLDTIDFGGDLGPRDIGGPVPVTISNVGAWNVRVTAEVTDTAQGLFVQGLNFDGSIWSAFGPVIPRHGDHVAQATLQVPEDYSGVGHQEGTIIFWAEEAP